MTLKHLMSSFCNYGSRVKSVSSNQYLLATALALQFWTVEELLVFSYCYQTVSIMTGISTGEGISAPSDEVGCYIPIIR